MINYIVTCEESHSFFLEKESEEDRSFLEVLLHYATHDELYSVASAGKYKEKALFTTRDEDVEFKKLLWTGVLYLARE